MTSGLLQHSIGEMAGNDDYSLSRTDINSSMSLQPQTDPVNNFMGYTYDPCMFEFSGEHHCSMRLTLAAGWSARLHALHGARRPCTSCCHSTWSICWSTCNIAKCASLLVHVQASSERGCRQHSTATGDMPMVCLSTCERSRSLLTANFCQLR